MTHDSDALVRSRPDSARHTVVRLAPEMIRPGTERGRVGKAFQDNIDALMRTMEWREQFIRAATVVFGIGGYVVHNF